MTDWKWSPDRLLAEKRALTETQWKVLIAVATIGRDGWPVSVREVAAYTGHASTQTVHATMVALEQLGLLATNPRHQTRRQGWRPTDYALALINA